MLKITMIKTSSSPEILGASELKYDSE